MADYEAGDMLSIGYMIHAARRIRTHTGDCAYHRYPYQLARPGRRALANDCRNDSL